MRCFAPLSDFKTIFEKEAKKKNAEFTFGKDRESAFDYLFRSKWHSLLYDNTTDFILVNQDQAILMDMLIRFGYCCISPENNSEVYLSCPLVRTHFYKQHFIYQWCLKPPQSHYSKSSLKDYAIDVIRLFCRFYLNEEDRSLYDNNNVYEMPYKSEFDCIARSDCNAIIQAEHPFRSKDGKIIGQIDFYLDGNENKGIEFVRTWEKVKEHVDRITHKYASLNDYLTIFCHESDAQLDVNDDKVKDLIESIKNVEHRKMLLIANFVSKFKNVIFFEISTNNDEETGEISSKLV